MFGKEGGLQRNYTAFSSFGGNLTNCQT